MLGGNHRNGQRAAARRARALASVAVPVAVRDVAPAAVRVVGAGDLNGAEEGVQPRGRGVAVGVEEDARAAQFAGEPRTAGAASHVSGLAARTAQDHFL